MEVQVIRYEFATGEVVHVEIDGEIAAFIRKSRRKEHASNERSRYHTEFSIDSADSRCAQLISHKTPDNYMIELENRQQLSTNIAQLSDVQRERLLMLSDGRSISEIARLQCVAYNSVKSSIHAARQKIRKNF